MSSPLIRFDWFEHIQGVTDYPTGNGGRTTVAANALTGLGKRVILHAITPANSAAGSIDIRNGDGSVLYFTFPVIAFAGMAGQPIDVELTNGLSVAGGSGGSFIVYYSLIR